MDVIRTKNIHIWISALLYFACLALPGYYIREMHEPQLSLHLLMMGWLGPLDGHFAWFANFFYLLALIKYRKPGSSSFLGFVALLFALSFLGYEKIIVSEAPTYAQITAYGLGYALWISSIGVLSLGQYCLANDKSERVSRNLLSSWLVIVLSIYAAHYLIGEGSLYSINVGRNSVFEEKCKSSGQNIRKKVSDATGVYFYPDWGGSYKRVSSGDWYSAGVGVQGLGTVNSGLLLFYEKNDDRSRKEKLDSKPKYRRFKLGDHRGIEVNSLDSEYAVLISHFDIPKRYGIYGAEIIIKDLRDNNVIATSSYVFDRIERKFCGHAPKGYFSVSRFVMDALNLAKKFPSGYEKK